MAEMKHDLDSMVQYAGQVQGQAASLAAVSSFDPSIFSGSLAVGLGPIGMPFTAAFMEATTTHMASVAAHIAAMEAHGTQVVASSQGFGDSEDQSKSGFEGVI